MAVASWGAGPEPKLRNRLRRWVGNTCLRSRSRVVRTTPEAYDYGYVVRVEGWPEQEGGFRRVIVPNRYAEYQRDRYLSGLYAAAIEPHIWREEP
jgi:hypothetical protein